MPKFISLDELVKFFETSDMGDYIDQLPEVHFDVDIKKRTNLFALDEDLARGVIAIAQAKGVPSEGLVNVWLREKLLEQT